jgi:predicted DNA-binding transcriptional regulator AlpA
MEKLLLTERETEAAINMSRSTLRKLWAKGELQPVHVGRSIRYLADEVTAYVARLREAQTGDAKP